MAQILKLSGFADEINESFDTQISCLKSLNMKYLCFRAADGKGIQDYSLEEFKSSILNRLKDNDLSISSLGSPIGKIDIDDVVSFNKQLELLDTFCRMAKLASCKYIRIFSFYVPANCDANKYKDQVIDNLKKFIDIAAKYNIVLIHENEKGIFGDSPERCEILHKNLDCENFKAAFDFANFVQCDYSPEEAFFLLKDYVVYIHIKDALYSDHRNVLCGSGDGQIKRILNKFLNDLKYSGFLTLEPHLVNFSTLKMLEHLPSKTERLDDLDGEGFRAFEAQVKAVRDMVAELGFEI